MTIKIQGDKITFPDDSEQTTAYDGSSGDSLWTDVDGKTTSNNDVAVIASLSVNGVTNTNQLFANKLNLQQYYGDDNNYIQTVDGDGVTQMEFNCAFGGYEFTTDNQHKAFTLAKTGEATFLRDMTVNGVTVGKGDGTGVYNTTIGNSALKSLTSGSKNTALGTRALELNTEGEDNVALGYTSLNKSTGNQNIGLGRSSGSQLTTGSNNIFIGHDAQPTAPDVSNEVTIGNDSVTKTRLRGDTVLEDGFVKVKRNDKEININPDYADTNTSVIESQHPLRLISNSKIGLTANTDGSVDMPNVYDGFNTSNSANIYMSSDGKLHRSTTATYSAEEVDKMLAIKDKLIEKMSARLDALEKRVK